ncbi:MAG: hypothetical protein RL148_3146 [Planctomycetota bacterium]|jgi:hypothetical protein
MDLWTLLAAWCVVSVVMAPLLGRFLRAGSASQTVVAKVQVRPVEGLARDVAASA